MKEKKKLAWLAGLLVVAAVVWYANARRPSATARASFQGPQSYIPLPVENPAIQWRKLEASRKTEYKSNGRDLFSEIAPPPPAPVASRKEQALASGPPPTPPPPPPPTLPPNLKFYGYGTVPNGTARRAFLTDGEEVYIVAEGDTLLGKYRIIKIGNAILDFEDIATGRRGSATLEEQATPAAS